MFNNERVRQIESKALRKLKRPTRSERLLAFIDSLGSSDSLSTTQHGHRVETLKQSAQFWNDGDAYSADRGEWFKYQGLTPAGFVEWLRLNPSVQLLKYTDLTNTQLPRVVLEWLEFVIGHGQSEEMVVTAFVEALASHDFTFVQTLAGAVGKFQGRAVVAQVDALRQDIAAALAGLKADRWPTAIVDFPETSI